jgi:outer membrane protein TolC
VRAATIEAEARVLEVESSRQAVVDEIRRDVRVAVARLREAHHVVEIYRSRLLPATRDQVRAARTGYESDRNDFVALIGAARGLRSLELRYHETLASYYRGRAALERAVGEGLASGSRDTAANDRTLDGPSIPTTGVEP